MVIWNVREVAELRGIKSAAALAAETNINKNTATILWNGNSLRVDRETLAKLCKALECTPGDILVYKEEDEDQKNESPERLILSTVT